MAVDDETRKRIYEEEKARAEAKEKVEKEIKKKKQNKQLLGCGALLVLFILFFVLVLGGGSEEGESPKETAKGGVTDQKTVAEEAEKEEKSYQQIFTFSGNGAKKSEPFTITGDRFKIKYDCNGDLCQAFVESTKTSFGTEIIMNTTGPVKDENIFYGSGEYYIDSNSLGTYTMVVEDYK